MNKIWKVVIICVVIVAAVVLYLWSAQPDTEDVDGKIQLETSLGNDAVSVGQSGDSASAGVSGDGFTDQQKEELRGIVEEAFTKAVTEQIDSSVRRALAESIDDMLESGRLEAGIARYAAVQSDLVNINTAGTEELVKLNGIGEAKAKAIIAYREEHGPFSDLNELTNVSGISEGTLQKFRDQVTL